MFGPALYLPNFHKNRIDKACVDFWASGSLSKIIFFWFPFCFFFKAINTFDYESALKSLKILFSLQFKIGCFMQPLKNDYLTNRPPCEP